MRGTNVGERGTKGGKLMVLAYPGVEGVTVRVVRSARRTVALQITQEAEVILRVPRLMREEEIIDFLCGRRPWLLSHLRQVRERLAVAPPKLTPEELQRLRSRAKEIFPERVAYYAALMGVTYGRITVRCQSSRWGSCSGVGNLNFNCLLLLAPEAVLDYVVVHELCHRKQMNHSPRFWDEVAHILPDWKERRTWLSRNGARLLGRV